MNPSALSQKGWLMPKALCLIGLVIACLVFLIFLLDIGLGMAGMTNMAPFRAVSIVMDVIFMVASAAVAYAAWITFREQR